MLRQFTEFFKKCGSAECRQLTRGFVIPITTTLTFIPHHGAVKQSQIVA